MGGEGRRAERLAGSLRGGPFRARRAFRRLATFVVLDGLRPGAGGLVGYGLRALSGSRRERCLERFHQIDDLRLRGGGLCNLDLLTFDLALYLRLDPLLDVVFVLLGLELVGRYLPDDLLGELELLRLHVRRFFQPDLVEGPHLVRVHELLHDEAAAVDGAQLHEILLAAGGIPRESGAAGRAHRLREQPVGAIGALLGPEVVGLVEVDGIDRLGRDELADLDLLRRLLLERLQLFGGEGDVAVLGELVAFHHLVALDHLIVVARADVLLLEAAPALRVQEVEGDRRLRLGGGEQADGDGDESEGDGPGCDRAGGHGADDNVPGRMPNFPASPFYVEQVGGGRAHYRIVLGGSRAFVLQKPPSPDPKDKRHAVLATAPDRPFEESASGILWDRGTCTEVQHQSGAGKLLFEFKGVKLRGLWTFIRTSRDWLLIKETADAHVRRGGSFPEGSIVSGFTLEELSGAAGMADEVREELQRAGAPRKPVHAAGVQPML